MTKLKLFLSIFIAVFPTNAARIFLYRSFLGYKIDNKSRIGAFTLLLASRVQIEEATIGMMNIIRIDSLVMNRGSMIGKLNFVSRLKSVVLKVEACILHRNFIGGTFGTNVECGREELLIGRRSQISLSCFLDLSDRITLGDNVVVAGSGTQFWTHGFDHLRKRSVASIAIGNDVFIGAASTVVQGVQICSYVTVGAGSVIHRSIREPGLYVSNNLRKVSS
jgi:acetyltransferase-like isoleucine patch superfamily enzyme